MDHSGARVPPPHGEESQFAQKSPPPIVQTAPCRSSSQYSTSLHSIVSNWPFGAGPTLGSPSNLVSMDTLPKSDHSADTQSESVSQELETALQEESSPQLLLSSMPCQQPILPQDRSSLNHPDSSGVGGPAQPRHPDSKEQFLHPQEQFHQHQQLIKENLVYPPVNPAITLPETHPIKSPFPKTPKLPQGGSTASVPSVINNPPESPITGEISDRKVRISDPEKTSEENRTQQQSARNTGYVNMTGGSAALSTASSSDDSNMLVPLASSGGSSSSSSSSIRVPALPHPARALQLPQAHNYEELDVIGNGAYGTVYRGRDLTEEGRYVALKKIKITLTDDGVPVSAVREISLLKQLETFRHPNVVRLLDICHGRLERENRLNLVLVFEYVEMDLDSYLKRVPQPGLEPPRIRNLMHQILSGVDFLHSNRIIHRDLKPQNILVDRYDRVKIADFGLARIYDYNMKLTTMVVTLWYRAPEVLLSNSYATPVDIWSCACIFAELFRKRPLFEGHSEGEQLQRIFEVIGTPPEHDWPNDVSLSFNHFRRNYPKPLPDVVPEISSDAADLLQRMLAFVPGSRASARQSLGHQYFDGVTADTVTMEVTTTTASSSGAEALRDTTSSGTAFRGSAGGAFRDTTSSSSSGSVGSSSSSSRLSDITTRRNSSSNVETVSSASTSGGGDGSGGAISKTTSSSSGGGSSVSYSTGMASMAVCDDVLDRVSRNSSSSTGGAVRAGNDENNPNSSNISLLGQQGAINKGLVSGQAAPAGPLQQQQSPTLPVSMFSSPPARSTPVTSLSTGVSNVSTSEHPR